MHLLYTFVYALKRLELVPYITADIYGGSQKTFQN